MNREKAITILKREYVGDSEDMKEAKRMAVSALKTELCEDCISREEALKIIPQVLGGKNDFADCIRDSVEAVISVCKTVERKSCEQIKWERDTAIAQLKELGYGFGEKIRLEDAIKDAISRQAVLKGIAEWVANGYADSEEDISHISSLVTHLPSVTPNSRWIPVSERLPKSHGEYQVTIQCEEGRYTSACYFDGSNTWHNDNRINHGRPYVTDKVIAWQEEPEPYKAESEDEEWYNVDCISTTKAERMK